MEIDHLVATRDRGGKTPGQFNLVAKGSVPVTNNWREENTESIQLGILSFVFLSHSGISFSARLRSARNVNIPSANRSSHKRLTNPHGLTSNLIIPASEHSTAVISVSAIERLRAGSASEGGVVMRSTFWADKRETSGPDIRRPKRPQATEGAQYITIHHNTLQPMPIQPRACRNERLYVKHEAERERN